MEEERKKLEKLYQELNEEDTATKKWHQALIPKSILDLLGFLAMGGLLVSGGVFLNYLLSKGK